MDQIKQIVFASLLHDIGKVFQRADKVKENHSNYGKKQLENIIKIDKEILRAVENHHAQELKKCNFKDNDISYLIYEADNIASASERRDIEEEEKGMFQWDIPLLSVFNTLYYNEKLDFFNYKLDVMDKNNKLNLPQKNINVLESEYLKISNDLKSMLKKYDFEKDNPNSLLYALKNILNYVPSSTNINQFADISLYEHVKLTAAIASCMYFYCKDNDINDYKNRYYKTNKNKKENEFLMVSMDISGIQKFIYTISSKGAGKMLKARSFYLELILEHIIDEILEKLSLTRANLIYSGGGHCYLILPNTYETKKILEEAKININKWFINKFGTNLFIAIASEECAAINLDTSEEEKKLDKIFLNLSKQISKIKLQRYNKENLKELLNPKEKTEKERECIICKESENIVFNEKLNIEMCSVCNYIYDIGEKLSEYINENQEGAYIIVAEKIDSNIELPGISGINNYIKISNNIKNLEKDKYKRIYTINQKEIGDCLSENISVRNVWNKRK